MKRKFLYLVVVVILVSSVSGGFLYWRSLAFERILQKAAQQPADNKLRTLTNQEKGSITVEDIEKVHKITFNLAIDGSNSTVSYHGWLFDPVSQQYRYAGQLYPMQDGHFSLVYTTEEDIASFTQEFISEEHSSEPQQPSNILLVGKRASMLD